MSVEAFLAALRKSGIVAEEDLSRSLAALKQSSPAVLADAAVLAQTLVSQGLLTTFQAEKLLQGKHKGFFLGSYLLLDRISATDRAAVYLAKNAAIQRRCALKILPTRSIDSHSDLRRFFREARALAAMDHPHIVHLHQVSQANVGDAEIHFLGMEYVEGRNLQAIVEHEGVLPCAQAVEYIRQAAEALAYIHELGLLHCRIEPSHLLVSSQGAVKICGFGSVRPLPHETPQPAVSPRRATLPNPPPYIAPELAAGNDSIDHRADIFSLGATLRFLLTGSSVSRDAATRLAEPSDEQSASVEELKDIVETMTSANPEDRYRSASDAAAALVAWLKTHSERA